jgi:hypothetical protein
MNERSMARVGGCLGLLAQRKSFEPAMLGQIGP